MQAIVHRKYGTPDVRMDTVGNRSVSDCRSVLMSGGTFVSCTGGPSMIRWLALKEIVEAGELKPVIERRYVLSEVADALRHVGERHAQGQTVIQIAG